MTAIRFTSDITARLIQSVGGDEMVVAAAKVSTSGEDALEWAAPERSEGNAGLIRYLMKNRHGTPFEHASLTFFVHAPAFVWWEAVRHRIGVSFNLESGRYKVLEPVFWIPRLDRKIKPSDKHKSARPDFVEDERLLRFARSNLEHAYKHAYAAYSVMIDDGIANEVARAALPFAVYYSGWMTMNPRSLMHFLSLRTHDAEAKFPSFPQSEIEEIGRSYERMFADGWPLTYKAFCENGRVAP